jgi:hypothetical protein
MFIRIARVDAGLRVWGELFVFNRLWVRAVAADFALSAFRIGAAIVALTIGLYYRRGWGRVGLSRKFSCVIDLGVVTEAADGTGMAANKTNPVLG